MKSVQVQLLESLGSGVRPFDPVEPAIPDRDAEFTHLLNDAINGRAVTDLGVRFGPAVSGEFDELEQQSISQAVDRAASAGVELALILHNERTLRVDVRNRMVLESKPISDIEPIIAIDGVVSSQSEHETELSDVPVVAMQAGFTPARIVRNASLVHALAGQLTTM